MKRKFAITILSLVCALSLSFGLAACNNAPDKPNGGHTHNYVWVDNGDGTHKQHCSVSGCNEPNINVENHVWGANKCEKCKAEQNSSEHNHVWSQSWESNETYHWHNCTAGGCNVTENSQKNGYAEHDFKNGYCVCGKQHNHVWSQSWESNETYHWHNCTAGGCNVTENSQKNGYAEHDFTNGTCACGKQAIYTQRLAYEFDNIGKVYTVTGLGDATDIDIIIPDYYNGYPVKYIGKNSFEGTAITSVKFGKNIMQVETSAFKDCTQLENVDINPECTIYLHNCFQNCTSLKRIELPSSASNVSNGAFQGCTSLEYADLGGVKVMVANLFNGCSSLKTVIANSLTSFAGNADMFENCTSLAEFNIPSRVERVSASWFQDTKLITIDNNIKYVGTWAVGFADTEQASVTLSFRSGTTGIDAYSFASDNVTDVYIPSTLNHIYGYFGKSIKNIYLTDLTAYLCLEVYPYGLVSSLAKGYVMYLNGSELTNLIIPTSITEIYAGAFYNCQSVKTVNIHSGVTKIGNGAFEKCNNIQYTEYKNGKYIGETYGATVLVEMIDKTATSFEFAPNIVMISASAFEDSSIESITVPESVKVIGMSAFKDCPKLTSVKLPSGLTEIAEYTFMNCVKLSNITLPDSVTVVSGGAFYSCSALTKWSFGENSKLEKINDAATIAGSTLTVGAFEKSGLEQIDFPATLSYIGDYAFSSCKDIKTLTIGSSVTYIGRYAFEKCGNMTKLVIDGTSETQIGSYAFESCSKLQSADVKAYFINTGAFRRCSSLSDLTLREGLFQLSYSVFAYNTSLYTVTLPSTLKYTEKNIFQNCSKLVELQNLSTVNLTESDIPSMRKLRRAETSSAIFKADGFVFFYDEKEQKTYLLLYEGNETEITLPVIDGEYELFNSAFENCTFTKVTIPEGVTAIADYVFRSCKSLSELHVSASVESISANAFVSCEVLSTIEIDENNAYYSSINGILYNRDVTQIIWASPNISGCIVIPETVITIQQDTFIAFEQITQIVMKGATRIEAGAFYYLTKLESIVLPKSLTFIGRYAFEECPELKVIYYAGTEQEWAAIDIKDNSLAEVAVYFYSESNPFEGENAVTDGHYWYYDTDGVTPVIWTDK